MDGICYSHTSNTKLSTDQCKRLKRTHICNKMNLLFQSYFITVRKLTHFKFYGHLVTATTLQWNLLGAMDGICYSHTSNTKLSTDQCKRLKRRHICNKKMLLLQSSFITVTKLTHFKFYGHLITLTTNVCWAESSHSKLFLTPLITTEYYPINPQCLNINQNDSIKRVQPCQTFKYTSEQPTYTQNLQFSSLKVIFVLFSPCIVNDNSLLVPTNAYIILIYITCYLAPTCFSWSPFSGSSEPNSLKLTAVN